jgi:gliding motility-associated protein GldL
MANFFKTKTGKVAVNFLYGMGAAVVIVGALFKITHREGADLMLTIGLLTEAVIFAISSFIPPDEEVDWTLAYPELANGEAKVKEKKSLGLTPTQQMDKMLQEAKIGPELLQSLEGSFKSLNSNVSKMANISDVSATTNEFATNAKAASANVSKFGVAAGSAAEALGAMAGSQNDAKVYSEQFTSLVKNVSDVNKSYASISQFSSGIAQSMQAMNTSAEEAVKFKDELGKLSKNLGALNGIYGNMLSAMQAPRA